MCTLQWNAIKRQTVVFWKAQKICTGFNQKINSIKISWKTFFSACCRKMLPRSLFEYSPVLKGVSTGWQREGWLPWERWSPEIAEGEMLCLCHGLEPRTTSDSCAAVLRKRWRRLPHYSLLHLFLCGFFLIIGKLTWEVGKRQGFAVDVPDALGLSSSSIFEECSKQYSWVFAAV